MKRKKFSRFLICMLLVVASVFTMTACSTAQLESDPELILDEETREAIELRTSIREVASGMEESRNTTVEDPSEFTVTLTMIESAEALIRSALEKVADELPEIQKEEVEAVLTKLYEAGILEEEAVYSLENLMFTYIYSGGILGGVHLEDPNEKMNTPDVSIEEYAPVLNTAATNSSGELQVVVFNGFENTSYRRDYYNSLESDWSAQGIDVTVDTDVTISDLTNLSPYDVVIFSMHGSTYNNAPIIAINEEVTTETDLLYSKYLTEDYSVAKVLYLDGSSHYWVLPDFFRNHYGATGLDNKLIYSESCCFYGCACYSNSEDTSFAQALLDSSAEAVVGYYNSVGADYSREMMKTTLESMFDGSTLDDALTESIYIYGADDGWEEPLEDKYPAYPYYMGNKDAVLTASEEPEAPVVPEIEEEPEEIVPEEPIPEEPAEGTEYFVDSTYIEGWPYVEDGFVTVFFKQDSFVIEDGHRTANVGFRDYLYLSNECAQSLQIGDTLQTADYLGYDILISDLYESGTELILNDEYILSSSSVGGTWLLCDQDGMPLSYPSVWETLPIADDAPMMSYGEIEIDPENPSSIFDSNPNISLLTGYLTISDQQITQIIFD